MKYTITSILLYIIAFCQVPDQSYIKNLSTKFKYHNMYVVIPITKKSIYNYAIVSNYALHEYFLKKFTNKDEIYSGFITNVLAHKTEINTSRINLSKYFLIDNNNHVYKEYKKFGLNFIIRNYLDNKGGVLRNNVTIQETLNEVIQIMFNNNYFVSFSDYSGYYYFSK